MNRRTFLAATGVGGLLTGAVLFDSRNVPTARLRARPREPRKVTRTLAPGVTRQTIGQTEVVAYLPPSAADKTTIPLMVFLHGANRGVDTLLERLRPLADTHGVMLLLPFAVIGTWDAIRFVFGPDVQAIDETLGWLFSVAPVDRTRLTLAGFSDGATYTLALGRANGDLFTRLAAFSPGFLIPVQTTKRPPILISHGRADEILPFENARDRIVPALVKDGYDVDFRPFDGPHTVPLAVAEEEIARLGATP